MTEWTGITRMSNNFGYLFKEGLRGFRKHGFMSFTAICVTVACMIIIGGFALISYNLNCMVRDLEGKSEILVFIDENYNTAEAEAVGTELSAIENIKSRTFVTRQEALEGFAEKYEDPNALEGISSDTFRDRFLVKLYDNAKLDETQEQIRAIEGVADISAPENEIRGFLTFEKMLNIASLAIIIVLFVVSLFVISNTVKLAMYDRREEIGIMKMVGATNGFIRFPFVIEGTILGVLSAGISFCLEFFLYDFICKELQKADSLQLLQAVPFEGTVLWVFAGFFLVVGLLVGVVGSVMSIRKFLDV